LSFAPDILHEPASGIEQHRQFHLMEQPEPAACVNANSWARARETPGAIHGTNGQQRLQSDRASRATDVIIDLLRRRLRAQRDRSYG
jgi:hypothetical protein